jgi:LemA protein
MKWRFAALAIGLGVAGGSGWLLDSARRDIETDHAAVDEAWTHVEVALDRRAAMTPGLSAAVGATGPRGREALAALATWTAALQEARTPPDKIRANQRLDAAIGKLLLAVEEDDRLRSSDSLVRLQEELLNAEHRIAVERRKYNEAVQQYNIRMELFPRNLAALAFGFRRNDDYFQTRPAPPQPEP